MKRNMSIILLIALLAAVPVPAFAQMTTASDVILLNDASPNLEAVITPVAGSTGVIQIEVADASVTILNPNGDAVFRTLHPSVQSVAVNFAPDAEAHTVVVERLPNATESYVRLNGLPQMPTAENTVAVAGDTLADGQATELALNDTTPSVIMWNVEQSSTLSAHFADPNTRAEIVDTQTNQVIGQLDNAAQIDGFSITLETGSYALAMQGQSLASLDLVSSVMASDFASAAGIEQVSVTAYNDEYEDDDDDEYEEDEDDDHEEHEEYEDDDDDEYEEDDD